MWASADSRNAFLSRLWKKIRIIPLPSFFPSGCKLKKKILYEGEPRFSLKEMRAIPPYKGPKRALVELMDEVERKVHHFRKECWNITIELLADHLGIIENPWKYSLPNFDPASGSSMFIVKAQKPNYPQFQELKEHIQKTGLIEAYIKAAKKEPWDYLGDIFTEEELAGRKNRMGQNLTPRCIVEFMVQMVGIGEKKQRPQPDEITEAWLSVESMAYDHKLDRNLFLEQQRLRNLFEMEPLWTKYVIKPQTVIDPAGCGTGRFLLGATWHAPKAPLVLFGIEIDLSLYRACLVNLAMFSNHPYSIVCGDALMIDTPYCSPGSKLWDMGNQWQPPDISSFYFKLKPPFKFSLAALAKARKEPPTPILVPLPQTSALVQIMRAKKKT